MRSAAMQVPHPERTVVPQRRVRVTRSWVLGGAEVPELLRKDRRVHTVLFTKCMDGRVETYTSLCLELHLE